MLIQENKQKKKYMVTYRDGKYNFSFLKHKLCSYGAIVFYILAR